MDINITSDAFEDALPNSLLNELYDKGFSKYFKKMDFGNNKVEIFMTIVCYPKKLSIRKRYDRNGGVIYWDVMLDYKKMKKANSKTKKSILAKNVIYSFEILDNYKVLQIDKESLKNNTTIYFKSIGWLN